MASAPVPLSEVLDRPDWSADQKVRAIASAADVVTTPCGAGEMVWRVWGRDAAKVPLVLMHGGSGSWNHWIKQIALFEQRYEIWAPDLPGLGDSAMPEAPLTPETCGRVVAEGLYQEVAATRRPHVVAFSFGAHVGTFATAMLGERIRSFTICGCAALGLPHGERTFAKEHARMSAAERAEVHRHNLGVLMIADPERIDDLAVHCQAENIRRARFRSQPFARSDEIAVHLPRVTAPVASIWGERDQIAQIPDLESRHRVLRKAQPNLVWRVIPDAGHWVMYEQPEAYNAALEEVLAGLERN